MKIDFEKLERMAEAGTPAKAIIEMLKVDFERDQAKKVVKRPKDAKRQRERRGATKGDKVATPSDTERHEATLSDTPRARLFREAKPALLTLKIADSRAGGLIVQWLKLTNDDDQLVLATILRAQSLAVADAPSWILATLKGKMNERSGSVRADTGANQSRTASIVAGVAAATQRRFGGGGQGSVPDEAEPAREPDPQLFGNG